MRIDKKHLRHSNPGPLSGALAIGLVWLFPIPHSPIPQFPTPRVACETVNYSVFKSTVVSPLSSELRLVCERRVDDASSSHIGFL